MIVSIDESLFYDNIQKINNVISVNNFILIEFIPIKLFFSTVIKI